MRNDSFILWASYSGLSFWSMFIKMLAWWNTDFTHTAYLPREFFFSSVQFVYEAWKKGGACRHEWEDSHHKKNTPVDVLRIACPKWFADGFYEYLDMTEGKLEYDTWGVVFGFLSKKERQNKKKVFCSEWGGDAQDYANKKRPDGEEPFFILDRIPAYKWTPALAHITPVGRFLERIYTP